MKIQMFDSLVSTLGHVAYVPKIPKNLISLGQLGSTSGRYSAKGGALKITHGYLILMKVEKCDGLYHLMREYGD